MRSAIKIAVAATIGLMANQAFSLGFETINTTGYPVSAGTHQPTGGTTPYKIFNPTGNYGSSIASNPTTTTNNTGAIVPAPASFTTSPETGFTLIPFGSVSRPIVMNNTLTGGNNITIGTVTDAVFRNATTAECIYATRVALTNTDYDTTRSGTQRFEVNGVARGGFASSGTVSAAYALIGTNDDVVYRAGRTFTSVQHRAATLSSGTPATGYYNLPLTPGSTASINGVNASALSVPSAADQTAQLDLNWVEFTTDANSLDDDGSTKPFSAALYVKAPCATATLTEVDNAIRLRQSWQEFGTNQEFIEVRVRGFVPPGGNANPAPVPGSTY